MRAGTKMPCGRMELTSASTDGWSAPLAPSAAALLAVAVCVVAPAPPPPSRGSRNTRWWICVRHAAMSR